MDKAIILLLIMIILVCLSFVCVCFLENARKKDPKYKNSKLNKKRRTIHVISILLVVGVPVTLGFAIKSINEHFISLGINLFDLKTYQKDSIDNSNACKDSVLTDDTDIELEQFLESIPAEDIQE